MESVDQLGETYEVPTLMEAGSYADLTRGYVEGGATEPVPPPFNYYDE
ncbi:lasso RiPP family leader peptide-containing protein [Streptomyces sp. NPDC050161]